MNINKLNNFLIAVCLLMTANAYALDFHLVADGFYRGPRPQGQDLAELKAIGVTTIVNIDNDEKVIRAERKTAMDLGLTFISIPLSGFWTPSDRKVDRILKILEEKATGPIYLHCKHGQDRTGLLVGLYRVFNENVRPAIAYKEMLAYGFHRELVFLNHYFEDRTGFED